MPKSINSNSKSSVEILRSAKEAPPIRMTPNWEKFQSTAPKEPPFLVKEWRTEVMNDNEKYQEDNTYPGVDGIIDYISLKIEERKKQQL